MLDLDEAMKALEDLPAILDLRDASRATGLSPATLRRRVASGELTALRTSAGRGGRMRFLKREVAKLLVAMAG
jgi:hypothetical protein